MTMKHFAQRPIHRDDFEPAATVCGIDFAHLNRETATRKPADVTCPRCRQIVALWFPPLVERRSQPRQIRQGRCRYCDTRWRWPAGRLRLAEARCPDCDRELRQTTHLSHASVRGGYVDGSKVLQPGRRATDRR